MHQSRKLPQWISLLGRRKVAHVSYVFSRIFPNNPQFAAIGCFKSISYTYEEAMKLSQDCHACPIWPHVLACIFGLLFLLSIVYIFAPHRRSSANPSIAN
jgi:hypothetical protein